MSSAERQGKAGRGRGILAVATIAVLVATAGAIAYQTGVVSPPTTPPAATATPTPPRPRPAADQPAPPDPERSVLSRLRVSRRPRLVVSLERPRYHDPALADASETFLNHEIVRQAVLAAARDAGAIVRDGSVGDPMPAGGDFDAEVGTFFPHQNPPTVTFWRRKDAGREPIATFELTAAAIGAGQKDALVERVEALSREKFPEVLASLGVAPVSAAARAGREQALSIAVANRLRSMTFTEAFAAARVLHEEMRSEGESVARLAGLARAYAHLGVLSEFHWNPAHKAYKARALLAAERLMARDGRTPRAHWHRAYARALSGLHAIALEDLAAVDRLARVGIVDLAHPWWVPLIDAYCRFQTGRLLAARTDPDGQLAALLASLTVEGSTSMTRAITLHHQALAVIPECYRVHDALCRVGGVGNLHWATMFGMQVFSQAVPRRLRGIPGLPKNAEAMLADRKPDWEVAGALVEAGRAPEDEGEPSWSALGSLMREVRFVQVLRRVRFMKEAWGVPVDEFLAEARPLFADHPYRAYIDSYGVDWQRHPEEYIALIKGLQIADIEPHQYPFVRTLFNYDRDRAGRLHDIIWVRLDGTYRDLDGGLHAFVGTTSGKIAKVMAAVSPHAPMARSRLIDLDWAAAEPHAREWEEAAGEHPDVLMMLGHRYYNLQRWDDAERCLVKAAGLSSDAWTYERLADTYKAQGRIDAWQETLDRYLTKEDATGLSHAQIQVDIAREYMRNRQYEKALPYAEEAAQTWAGWAIEAAARCHEAMGHWDQAELWYSRQGRRYPGSWKTWFHFCKRTGHGDLAAARRLALEQVARFGDQPNDRASQQIADFHDIDGATRESLAIAGRLAEDPDRTTVRLMAAALADELGDTDRRDRLLDSLLLSPPKAYPKLDGIVQALRPGLSKDGKGRMDPDAVEAAWIALPGNYQEAVGLHAARLMHAHGAADMAASIVKRIVEWPDATEWGRTRGSLYLRAWGVPLEPDRPGPVR